jgi:hypothetical protein
MTTISRKILAVDPIVCVVILAVAASPALAQRRGGMGQMPVYDTGTEITFQGTVEDVRAVSGGMMGRGRVGAGGRMGARGMGTMQGTYVTVRTDAGTIEVHFGPSAFLKDQKVEIEKGDALEIVGSRVKIGDGEAVLAREVRKGETSWSLRDPDGRPRWAMMGGR